jgi:hypothetical protein
MQAPVEVKVIPLVTVQLGFAEPTPPRDAGRGRDSSQPAPNRLYESYILPRRC